MMNMSLGQRSESGAVLLLTSDRFVDHVTPSGHPERSDRAKVMASVAARWVAGGGPVASPTVVSTEALLKVHAAEYIKAVDATAGRTLRLDPDTYTSAESGQVARLAVGATVAGVDRVLARGGKAFAFVRPPGHHAERERAMGFCIFNNISVAAAHALSRGIEKVVIVDYDVHHGNGTQWMFYGDPRVLYVSVHQYPFYPGTGAAEDVGVGAGRGFTFNVPIEAGAGDADYFLVFREAVVPVLKAFDPELILLSAGYDGHKRDPLGGMNLSTDGYSQLTRDLCVAAEHCCGGRIVAVTEGGYDLESLEACLGETLTVMRGPEVEVSPPGALGSTMRADVALSKVRRAQATFWPAL